MLPSPHQPEDGTISDLDAPSATRNSMVPVRTSFSYHRRSYSEMRMRYSGNVSMGKDSKIGISRHLDLQLEHPVKVPTALVGTNQSIFSDVDSNKSSEARNN